MFPIENFPNRKLKQVEDLKPGDYVLSYGFFILETYDLSERQNKITVLTNIGMTRYWTNYKDFQFYVL